MFNRSLTVKNWPWGRKWKTDQTPLDSYSNVTKFWLVQSLWHHLFPNQWEELRQKQTAPPTQKPLMSNNQNCSKCCWLFCVRVGSCRSWWEGEKENMFSGPLSFASDLKRSRQFDLRRTTLHIVKCINYLMYSSELKSHTVSTIKCT